MDLGFHSVISRALMLHVTADQGRCRQVLNNSDLLSHIIHSMDSRADKQKFLEQYHSAFMIPKRLEFQGQQNEDLTVQPLKDLPQPGLTAVVECELQKTLSADMDSRLSQLVARTNHLRMESDEIWKTVETAEVNLLEILNQKVGSSISFSEFSSSPKNYFDRITTAAESSALATQEVTITQCRASNFS